MKDKSTLSGWGLVILGIVIGVVLGIVEGNGPLLSAFSGVFAGALVYGTIILLRARNTKEDSYIVQDEKRRANRNKNHTDSPRQRTQQMVQDAYFQTPPKTR